MKKLWLDITTNRETGHYIALDVFKAVSFAVGIALIVDAQVYGRSVESGVTLLLLAYGLQNSKLVSQYFQRRTEAGNGRLTETGFAEALTASANPVMNIQRETTANETV